MRSSACYCAETKSVFSRVTDPHTLESFSVMRCSLCGLLRTEPKPAKLEAYYGERYYGNRHWIWASYCAWRRRRILNLSARPGKLLDIGCGDGEFLLSAARSGWDVTGTELDRAAAAARGLFTVESLESAQLNGPYRCLTLWHVLEHLTDPFGTMQTARTLLDADGVFVIAVPNAGGWQARLFGRYWFHLDVPRHLYHFEQASLTMLLNRAGFEILQVWHHELEYDWFGWIQSALNMVAPKPNLLFDALTRKPPRAGRLGILANYCAAVVLAPIAFALTVVSTLAGSGGTLAVAARPIRG